MDWKERESGSWENFRGRRRRATQNTKTVVMTLTQRERALKAVTVQAAFLFCCCLSKPQTVAGIPLRITTFLREWNFNLLVSLKKNLKLDTFPTRSNYLSETCTEKTVYCGMKNLGVC